VTLAHCLSVHPHLNPHNTRTCQQNTNTDSSAGAYFAPTMPDKGKQAYDNVVYDLFLWVFTIVVDLFFREIHPRSTWRIPKKGPVLFVAAPHANQFVDPLILMRTVRQDARRRIAFLIAEKSTRRKFVGFASSLVGAVPVGRALDQKKSAKGIIYLPEPENDPTLVRGEDTNFEDAQFMVGGLLVLPSFQNTAANAEILEILGPNEIRLKKPFKGDVAEQQLAGLDPKDPEAHLANGSGAGKPKKGTKFSVAPHVDQHAVYDAVFDRVAEGGCIGIFPEGGSHDRTELLPLKAGLAIMALGSLAKNPDCNVSIVPVGMNYFNAHKFRSRCVIEFGQPITIDDKILEQYKAGDRRDAVGHVLNEVQDALKSVTLQAPDYDTLMLIQAVRRLYNPKGKKLPLPAVIELQRRFLKGYAEYKDDPRIIKTRKAVLDYNKQLMHIGIRDHQLSYARFPWYKVVGYLLYRLAKLAILSIAVIPGLVFFSPVFIAGKLISIKKSKEALAASSVKIKARDVVATWKILVSLALAPALNVVYTVIGTYWTHKNRIGGRVPDWAPLWFVVLFQMILFPSACFAALRFGEIGMDIFKSIRPLVLSLNPNSSNTLVKLRERRARLQAEITEIVDELGPELFPDFDKQRIVPDQKPIERPSTPTHRRHGSEPGDNEIFSSPPSPLSARKPSDQLPRNESFQNIGKVGFFASRPTTPNRSRSRTNSASDGLKLTRLTSLTSTKQETKSNMEEVSKNLSEALRERRGRRQDEPNAFEFGDEEGSSEEDEEPTKKNM
jgi:glycerol-3-phosphate O-acyltransferase/dihydroxyacetone phosphate acyltransferase